MINYSELFVLILLVPVVMQIIIPLLMLVGWGGVCFIRLVFWRQKIVDAKKDDVDLSEGLQLSRG